MIWTLSACARALRGDRSADRAIVVVAHGARAAARLLDRTLLAAVARRLRVPDFLARQARLLVIAPPRSASAMPLPASSRRREAPARCHYWPAEACPAPTRAIVHRMWAMPPALGRQSTTRSSRVYDLVAVVVAQPGLDLVGARAEQAAHVPRVVTHEPASELCAVDLLDATHPCPNRPRTAVIPAGSKLRLDSISARAAPSSTTARRAS